MDNTSDLARTSSSNGYSYQQQQQPSEVPSYNTSSASYASRPISSPPGSQPPLPTTVPSASAYPRSSSPPYTGTNSSSSAPLPSSGSNPTPGNNAAYRPVSSSGPPAGGTYPAAAAQQRPYQPMAGQPPQATIPQNPQPPSGTGPPLLRRMDSRSSISAPQSGGGGGGQPAPTGQPQLNRPPSQPSSQMPTQSRPQHPQNMMRPAMQQPLSQNAQQPQQMFRQQGPGTNLQQFQKLPPNLQQSSQQQQQRQPMMMMRPQMVGQQLAPQMRPQFPGPRPTGPNPNQPNRPTMQAPGSGGQFQPRMDSDLKAPDSFRPSSRNGSNGKFSALYDDDDDVVIGRATTPNYQARPNTQGMAPGSMGSNGNRDPQLARPPSQQGSAAQFIGDQLSQPFQMQRNDSKRSIPSRPPSRPPSGPDNPSSPSPEGMLKQGVSFLEGSDGTRSTIGSALNMRSIPEIGRSAGEPTGQQFRVGQPVNKPMVPNPNFQSSSVNLNSILNVDRSRPMSREPPGSSSSSELGTLRRESEKIDLDLAGTKGDNDSGVDESTQGNERNGPATPISPLKSPSKIPGLTRPTSAATTLSKSRSSSKSRLTAKTPETPVEPKKVSMNKVQVGATPSPNLKAVRSKIGSLQNATHKPGGGNVKIETKKVEVKAAPRIAARNDQYVPGGGDKKITQTKLQWSAQSKIGSLENTGHKPRGGDKKIETVKLDFKERSRSKVGSKDFMTHVPGGGDVKESRKEEVRMPIKKTNQNEPKIITHKVEVKAQSKIGSLGNMNHKPGGGDKKIFDDKEYLKNVDHPVPPNMPSSQTDPESTTTDPEEQ